MADLDSNGLATLGQGVFTQTADVSVNFVSEEFQLTDYGANASESIGPDLVDLGRVPVGAGDVSGVVPGGLSQDLFDGNLALKDGLDLGPLTGIFDGIQDNPYAAFGVSPPPTIYKMRGWQTVGLQFEYWTAVDAPSIANPSGLPITGVTVVAVHRPRDLVGS